MYRIIAVDDEPMLTRSLTKLLHQAGIGEVSVRTAQNGREALELVRQETPDIVFTDIRMPVMDGLELCRTLAAMNPAVLLVVVSGFDEFEYARQCMSYGVKEYLLKPITMRGLTEVLPRLTEQVRELKRKSISARQIDEWIDELAEAVWTGDGQGVQGVIDRLKQSLQGNGASAARLGGWLEDCAGLLIKKLRSRGMNLPTKGEPAEEPFPAGFDDFHRMALGWMEELGRKRRGQLRDPIEAAKEYIDTNLALEGSLEEVAQLLGLSPTYFSHLFKQETGQTFVQYRIMRRMEKAKRLLEIPHYRISDIAYEIGYTDPPHFTKMFKKMTGRLPSEYRSMMGIE